MPLRFTIRDLLWLTLWWRAFFDPAPSPRYNHPYPPRGSNLVEVVAADILAKHSNAAIANK